MIAIIDYGAGNLYSLSSSLSFLGLKNEITENKNRISASDRIILPGVGAFKDAIKKLDEKGLSETIKQEAKKGKPLLGICLGMQLLFDRSFEYGEHKGLGLISGDVCPIRRDIKAPLKVPHIGWNKLDIRQNSPLLKYTDSDYFYYVHSYYAMTDKEYILGTSEYEIDIPGAVGKDNVTGCQFHPEKSGDAGLRVLKAFSEIK